MMQIGIISKLFHDKKYGNINTDNGEEFQFHKGCLWEIPFAELMEGQEVEFEIQSSYKGRLAFHIRQYKKDHQNNIIDETEDDPKSLYCSND